MSGGPPTKRLLQTLLSFAKHSGPEENEMVRIRL